MVLPAAAIGYAIVSLGGALLRVALKQLPKYLKKGAKEIKKPTVAQRKKAKPAEPSPTGKDTRTKADKDRAKWADERARQSEKRRQPPRGQKHKRESAKELDPDKDIGFVSEYPEDIPFNRGGSVKGRPAKRSAENS